MNNAAKKMICLLQSPYLNKVYITCQAPGNCDSLWRAANGWKPYRCTSMSSNTSGNLQEIYLRVNNKWKVFQTITKGKRGGLTIGGKPSMQREYYIYRWISKQHQFSSYDVVNCEQGMYPAEYRFRNSRQITEVTWCLLIKDAGVGMFKTRIGCTPVS